MEPLFTPETLAVFLGLSPQTIYNRHSLGGDLPRVIKIGRLIRFHPKDVDCWLERLIGEHVPGTMSVKATSVRRRGRPTKAEQVAARKRSC